jgi:hypothetical protein
VLEFPSLVCVPGVMCAWRTAGPDVYLRGHIMWPAWPVSEWQNLFVCSCVSVCGQHGQLTLLPLPLATLTPECVCWNLHGTAALYATAAAVLLAERVGLWHFVFG